MAPAKYANDVDQAHDRLLQRDSLYGNINHYKTHGIFIRSKSNTDGQITPDSVLALVNTEVRSKECGSVRVDPAGGRQSCVWVLPNIQILTKPEFCMRLKTIKSQSN